MNKITVNELARRKRESEFLQIVDVRSPQEYRAGHIPGAMNIPMETIAARTGDLDAKSKIMLVCQSGKRAETVYERLRGLPLALAVLEGGTAGWKAAGFALVSEQAAGWSLDRQIRLIAGLLILAGTLGSFAFRPLLGLTLFVGGGLTFSGLTGWCGMGLLLAQMPWNRALQPAAGTERIGRGAEVGAEQ